MLLKEDTQLVCDKDRQTWVCVRFMPCPQQEWKKQKDLASIKEGLREVQTHFPPSKIENCREVTEISSGLVRS